MKIMTYLKNLFKALTKTDDHFLPSKTCAVELGALRNSGFTNAGYKN